MLLNTLIIFFIFLIGYQIILANSRVIEGAEGGCDIAGDAYRLSQQNSAEITTLKKTDEDTNKRIDTLDSQMRDVMQSVKEMGNAVSNPKVPNEPEKDPEMG